MKTTKSAIRITTLIVLFSVGFVSLFAEPLDDSPWWFEQFINTTKTTWNDGKPARKG